MRVVTLTQEQFVAECRSLEAMAKSFCPDLVLGIANGGVCVAEQMFTDVPHAVAYCHRVSSHSKKRYAWAFAIIRRLPIGVRNVLRIAEAKFLPKNGASTTPFITDDISKASRILVVDDAVDSGATMAAVCCLLQGKTIATAAITVTTQEPKIRPDFVLYANQTLIRFPWSKDA